VMESVQVETRSCPRCSAPVGEQAQYCEGCGSKVDRTARRACQTCREVLSPTARFCPHCGTQAPGAREPRGALGAARWARIQSRLAAIDWAHVNRTLLPATALLLAGLIGFVFGQQSAPAPAARNPLVTSTRSWRGVAPSPGTRPAAIDQVPGDAPPDLTPKPALPLTRFRDFHITASSWELAHPPELAADGDPYSFWHAWKTERFSNGEWLSLTFPTERIVTRIGLLPGRMGAGARAEGRIRSLLVKAPGGSPQKLLFADRPELQYRFLKQPVRTRKLVLRVATVLPGRETRHILIPEVQVWGHQVPRRLTRSINE